MSLAPGTRIGPYDVVGPIGAGGMGEVYRARDTKLRRDVALKLLPEAFASDPDRLARFRREAEVLASLNHPNIAHVYGLEEVGSLSGAEPRGTAALVMELVDGTTIADRLARGAIPVDQALAIARQIAAALEAAHARGIVHRDLKPANVMVKEDGTVKVLDFGLAKALDPSRRSPSGAHGDSTHSPTMTSPAAPFDVRPRPERERSPTSIGTVLGTAGYMPPEQARGRPTDERGDIWAFGCVLYEMLTGRRAFGGNDVTETIAAVLRDDPDWAALPPDLPATLHMFLRRTVEKDPRDRVRDIGDMRLALSGAFDAPASPPLPPPRPSGRSRALVGVGALVLAAATGALAWMLKPAAPSPAAVRRFRVVTTPAVLAIANTNRDIAITPAGTAVVYFGGQGSDRYMFVQRFDAIDPTPLQRADRFYEPLVSPDGHWVAFIDEIDLTLRKVAVSGGPTTMITRLGREMLGATWGQDDTIVFALNQPGGGLQRVAASGGAPAPLTTPRQEDGETMHAWPVFLPGGRALLYTIRGGASGRDFNVGALDLATGAHKVIVRNAASPRYAPGGYLVYAIEDTLRAVRFDPDRLEVQGDPVVLVEGVATKASGGASFDIAADGTLAYVAGTSYVPRRLVWVDRSGAREPVAAAPLRGYLVARLSPDGSRVALDVRDQLSDIWIWDFARRALTRFTADPAVDSNPVWIDQGRTLVFTSARTGVQLMFSQAVDGTGSPTQLSDGHDPHISRSASADGSRLFFDAFVSGNEDLMALDVSTPRRIVPLLQTRANERNAELSPDGRWLAYSSDESGQHEVYVRSYPNLEERRWQVSVDGGSQPVFSARGNELFFLGKDGRLMGARYSTTDGFAAAAPNVVLEPQYYSLQSAASAIVTARGWDVSPDGRRFLMIETADVPDGTAGIVVVLNWAEELKRLLPPP
jgi:serine/threonine-protein kinase